MKHLHPLTFIPLLVTLGACQMVSDDELAKRTDALTDADNDGFTSTEYGGDDCDDDDDNINPAVTDTPYDGVDNDCSGEDLTDVDGDGHDADIVGGDDCDDDDGAINPATSDTPYDGIDNDCSGADMTDVDGDGHDADIVGGDDCDDDDGASNPAATDTPYDGIDNDCSGADMTDVDGDGHDATIVGGDDCDDDDGAIRPGGVEVCDSVDNNCDGEIDEAEALGATVWYADSDGDSYGDADAVLMSCSTPDDHVLNSNDCDDSTSAAHPGGTEVCGDGLDNDCNGETDEPEAVDASTWYADDDDDSFGAPDTSVVQCDAPGGYVADNTDCNDGADAAYPGGTEVCGDGLDNDCNDEVDEDAAVDAPTWYADGDGDDFGDPDTSVVQCDAPSGYVADNTDCNDAAATAYPGGTEVCGDGLDNDCNDEVDEDAAVDAPTWYVDLDEDGFGDPDTGIVQCDAPSGYVDNGTDCNDSSEDSYPGGTEICGDGLDNDCNDETDEDAAVDAPTWYVDLDEDGFGDPDIRLMRCDAPSGYIDDGTDCNDSSEDSYPGGTEVCGDGLDNDCNDEVDEGTAVDASTWYADDDEDGFGDLYTSLKRCDAPSGYVTDDTDCHDDSAYSYPGAVEVLGDDLDSDCNGDNNGFEFVSIPTDGNVLQGPVLTRHGTSAEEKIRVAWTTKECEKDGLTVHNCVIVETRPGVDIHTATSHRYTASHPAAIGSELYGFDFVSNDTHWGWVRAFSGHDGSELELGGHDISTGSTTTWNLKALPGATEDWTDVEAGLSSSGEFSAIACSDAAVGSPGIIANLMDLAEFSEGIYPVVYQDTIDEPYRVCGWDPLSSHYYLLSMYPTYAWDRWKFDFPVYDTLTYTDSWDGYPVLDLEMKKDVGYFGRAYLVDTDAFPGGSEMYLDFAKLDTPTSGHYPLDLALQPVELDLALTLDGRVLVCSLTEDGTPLLQLIDPLDAVEPLTVDAIPNTELTHIIDCSIAVNQGGEALVVYRSDYTLFEGHFDLL